MNNLAIKVTLDKKDNLPLSTEEIVKIVNESFFQLKAGLTKKLEIEIIFATDSEIKELNCKHRKIDKPTDVLSFPQDQAINSPENILGSIVISNSMVEKKEEALSDVLKHGLLHLLGYDHEENEAEWQKAANEIECHL